MKAFGLVNKCLQFEGKVSANMTCGKILSHCLDKVGAFRHGMGLRVCVFKIGVTANPLARFGSYAELNFNSMWLLHMSNSVDLIHMLEAAMVSSFHKHVGCRNKEGTGGEGALNRLGNVPSGPYFLYVTGGRADQPCRVG